MENGDVLGDRRGSLASQMENMTRNGAIEWTDSRKSSQMNECRTILGKPTGKRSLEDIHVLKSLLASSKLLDFFANLDAFKIDRLYQSLELITYDEKETVVFYEGDDGDSFFLVYSGQVEVMKKEVVDPAQINKMNHLAFLGPGDTFGERALLSATDVRAATVITSSAPTELIVVHRDVLSDLLNESHVSTNSNMLEVTKRFRSNKDIVRNIFMRCAAQRSEKDLKFAVEYLQSVKFFSRFSFEVRKQLCKVLRLISAVTNTVVFVEGQVGRHFYIIFTGCADVSVRSQNRFEETKEIVVSRLGEGESFGELALSQVDGVRRATVVCTEFCELLILGRDEYEPLIQKYQNEYHAQYAQMLRKNPYFSGPEWDDNTIEGMCSVMTEKYISFKGEICKQGSRASELFIVTRGECRLIYEGKHPITNAQQIYELGRFGPNSVLGCAEASAGKFNDIYVREYSILAESPMKILVLSRFDIFHLMSAEARDSLQRSSIGYVRESIQSRALKSVAWEKYKKAFISSVMTENRISSFRSPGAHSDGRAFPMLMKSQSAPLLTRDDARTLVDPCSFMLERRKGNPKRACQMVRSTTKFSTFNEQIDVEHVKRADKTPPVCNTPFLEETSHSLLFQKRRDTLNTKANQSAAGLLPSQRGPSRARALTLHSQQGVKLPLVSLDDAMPTTQLSMLSFTSDQIEIARNCQKSSSDTKKQSGALLPTLCGAALSTNEYCVWKEKKDKVEKTGMAGTSNTATIWNPVHGVCQPFTVLGFMKEKIPRSASKRISLLLAPMQPRVAKFGADQLRKAVAAVNAGGQFEYTRFRVFGKVCSLDDALDLFRQICTVEKIPKLVDRRDCSQFAIYKDDKMIVALENVSTNDTEESTAQFRAADLLRATGQRFACIYVSLQLTRPVYIEGIGVHVYQCFPTPQSAVRFARQSAATLLPPGTLSVVPLFEWISLADLERFDARNDDIEQNLELAMHRGGYKNNWEARKEAVKKVAHKVLSPTY